MKAMVLCAGYGTRLGPLTDDVPKPLLPIEGKPLLGYTLSYLAAFGFNEVAVNLHYKAEAIKRFLGDGSAFGVKIRYSFEESLLGTAGAVKKLEEFFTGSEPFLVLYGDLLIDQDLTAMTKSHRAKEALGTLLVHKRENSNSTVFMDKNLRIEKFVERPSARQSGGHSETWINSGVYLLSPLILESIPAETASDFPKDVFSIQTDALGLYGFPLTGYRCAIDSPERYQEAQDAVRSGHCQVKW